MAESPTEKEKKFRGNRAESDSSYVSIRHLMKQKIIDEKDDEERRLSVEESRFEDNPAYKTLQQMHMQKNPHWTNIFLEIPLPVRLVSPPKNMEFFYF